MLVKHQQCIRRHISLDFCILFLIAKFYKKLLKERNVLQSVVTEQCFEKQYFDNEK